MSKIWEKLTVFSVTSVNSVNKQQKICSAFTQEVVFKTPKVFRSDLV